MRGFGSLILLIPMYVCTLEISEADNYKLQKQRMVTIAIDDCISRLKMSVGSLGKFPLSEEEIENICFNAKNTIRNQPSLLELEPPVTICGDIHGQFTDLLGLFRKHGEPAIRNYLFLGDYVDRGKQSLECICLLLIYKIKHPQNFFLLRGNHETPSLNKTYGFYHECKIKLSIKVWKLISDVFTFLPVAAVVGSRIFCVHGGLSPQLNALQQINYIKKPIQLSESTLATDLLWADPHRTQLGWKYNYQRGTSFTFGQDVIQSFLKLHDFDFICRSHQVVEEGYQFLHGKKILTIFSAPNYCGEFNNLGAILEVSKNMICRIEHLDQICSRNNKTRRQSTPAKASTLEFKNETEKKKEQFCKARSGYRHLSARIGLRSREKTLNDSV